MLPEGTYPPSFLGVCSLELVVDPGDRFGKARAILSHLLLGKLHGMVWTQLEVAWDQEGCSSGVRVRVQSGVKFRA